ncbi:MAG: hypothetical protein JW932_07275 [Deltaproteobacteria bacterium]|nr:hypothetical protein [Deltaproteobacteria bacterium]
MMNIFYPAYILLVNSLFFPCLLAFLIYYAFGGRHRKRLLEHLGFKSMKRLRNLSGYPRIWIHAVSLGEMNVGVSIIKALMTKFPKSCLILSATTKHGYEQAEKLFKGKIPIIYAPSDFLFSVRKMLSNIRPHIIIFLETEIWPTWIKEAHKRNIKIALVNGRISKESFKRYLKIKPLISNVLKDIDAFSMISNVDALRIQKMGAEKDDIAVNGNAKYDLLPTRIDNSIKDLVKHLLNIKQSQPVFIAGSTREGEEVLILDAYQQISKTFPSLIMLIAPRHIKRTREIESLLRKRGHAYHLYTWLDGFTNKRRKQVVIVDKFGELFHLYSIGTIIFCGGSLVTKGGQNPLEAAVWGKVVFYGPYMDNFLDATALLEEVNAGICVSHPGMLADKAIWYLQHPIILKDHGNRAREAVIKNGESAVKHTRVISDLLN